jgi:hypothetical protein
MTLSRITVAVGAAVAILFGAFAWYYACYYWFLMPADQDPALTPPSPWVLAFLTLAMIGGVDALWRDRTLPLLAGLAGYLALCLVKVVPLFFGLDAEAQQFGTARLSAIVVLDPQFVVPLAAFLLALPRLFADSRRD